MRAWVVALATLVSACAEAPPSSSSSASGGGGIAAGGKTATSQSGAGGGMTAGAASGAGGAPGVAGATPGGAGGGSAGSQVTEAGAGGTDSDAGLEEWPNATNTGVAADEVLTPSQSLVVTNDGQVIEGLELAGSIIVRASDVVIRNSKLTNDATAIRFEEGSNLRVEHVTFVGTSAKTLDGAIQAWGDITVRRIQVSGFGEGIDVYGAGGLIEDSYFHDMANADGKLMDGIEAWEARQLIIRHNVIEMPDGNSVIKLPLDVPVPGGDDVLIENNLLAGGGYAVYGGYDPPNSNPSYTNVRFVGNRFSTVYEPKCGYYGPGAFIESSLSHDNVWHETSEPLEL